MQKLSSEKSYTSRVDQIASFLIQGIRGGQFVPGQRLVESDLTEELGISRGPLREAFRLLAEKGVIDLIPNRGAIVRRLNHKDIEHRFHLINLLGSMALSQTSLNTIDKAHLDMILKSKNNDNANVLSHSIELYCYLARCSNNLLLENMIDYLNVSNFSRHMINLVKLDTELSMQYFTKIYHAIMNDNHEEALDAHTSWCQNLLSYCENQS